MCALNKNSLPRRSATAALFAGALLLLAPASSAACSKLTQLPAKKKYPNRAQPPLAIGDSTMILSAPYLARLGFRVDARGCRSLDHGIDVLRSYKRRGRLPHMVAVALGANQRITGKQLRRVRRVVGPRRHLVLVAPRELNNRVTNDAPAVRRYAASHQGEPLTLLDWQRFSRGRRGWFWSDQLHMTDVGARRYAQFLARALPYALPPKARPQPVPVAAPAPAATTPATPTTPEPTTPAPG